MLKKTKKIGLGFMVVVFVFMAVSGSFLKPKPVYAAIPVSVVSSVPNTLDTIFAKIREGLKVAVLNAAVQTVSYFMHKMAYDTAVYMASGFKGQKPAIFTSQWDDFLVDTMAQTGAKAVGELAKPLGLNVCNVPDLSVDLAMRLSLQKRFASSEFGMEKPECTFQEMKLLSPDAWKSKYADESGNFDAGKMFNFTADFVEQGDLGIYLTATEKIQQLIQKDVLAAQLDRSAGQGVKAIDNLISGKIATPQVVLREELRNMSPSQKQNMSLDKFGDVMGTAMEQVIPSALSTFLNTLLNQGLKNLVGMFNEEDDLASESLTNKYAVGGSSGGRRQAEKMFSELLMPQTTAVERYNVLAEFSSCPGSPGMNNCALDTLFAQAVQEADYGRPITIREAIEKDWLHGSYKLISPENRSLDSDPNCYQQAYCYSNVKKLRKARILPLGFEIATKNSDPDKPWTLKEVVDGFDECKYIKDSQGNIVSLDNDPINFPFCHLIDPNWVLKVPLTRCEAMGYTNNLLNQSGPQRMSECVDMSNCVKYDNKGNCVSYGYCVREKNIWKIPGTSCDSQYNTCLAFKDSSGNTAGYLRRTLDNANCNQDSVGCTSYSLNRDVTVTSTMAWKPLEKTSFWWQDFTNKMMFFNKNLSSSCSANSAGCSAFRVSEGNADTLYLKKAPIYLGCYDSDPKTEKVEWPQSRADLSSIKSHKDCSNYAGVCIPEEENCNWYTEVLPSDSQRSASKIPGRYKPAVVTTTLTASGYVTKIENWNNECDKTCVGYDAYREMNTNYSNGQEVAYIIPASGKTCTSVQNECTAFTNLSTVQGSAEKVEYYTYLRPCILPDEAKQKTFYTYEGSSQGGYQLKVYILEQDGSGGPKQSYRTGKESALFQDCASGKTYKIDADCREFNDEKGKVYYRLLSKTIAVDKTCTPYRLSELEMYNESTYDSDQMVCEKLSGRYDQNLKKCYFCFQNGKYDKGHCIYQGLPANTVSNAGNSTACTAEANTCRAYKGNSANTVKVLFKDGFESPDPADALLEWSGDAYLSAEATYVGGHSVGYAGSGGQGILFKKLNATTTLLETDKSYVVRFWAKSDSSKQISVGLHDGVSAIQNFGTVSVRDVWNYYELGPIKWTGGIEARLFFNYLYSGAGNQIFLDNVEFIGINDVIYLTKNSLSVGKVCDDNLTDNLPGQALGCKAYSIPNSQTPAYLTGFDYLCREDAIGCTAVLDTYNTIGEAGENWYNVWLSAKSGTKAEITFDDGTVGCQVPLDDTGCYVNILNHTLQDIVTAVTSATSVTVDLVTSTVHIPADTTSTAPLYLVADKKATCNQIDIGCTYAGLEKETPSGPKYTTVLVKNDPASYADSKPILCQQRSVGCGSYSSGNSTYYFKDPLLIGQRICSYQSKVTVAGTEYSGWFWKDVGACGTSTNKVTQIYSPQIFCTSDSDCSKSTKGATCVAKGEQACYPDYLKAGNDYGLWSFGNKDKYDNFVGECPVSQTGCTEFVDRNDNNKPYYVINDSKIQTAQSKCNGQVSLKEGCVLFDQTEIGNKLWNTMLSYKESELKKNALITPISSSTNNDANVIMQVTRDRECGEWLQCRTSHNVWDDSTGEPKYKEVCDLIGRCGQAKVVQSGQSKDKQQAVCTSWLDGVHEDKNTVLTETRYRSRKLGWKNMDYSGLSILNSYPLEELSQVNFGAKGVDDWRLAKLVYCGGGAECENAKDLFSYACSSTVKDGTPCGEDGDSVCVSQICVKGFQGGSRNIHQNAPKQNCRAYPEKDSPYPNTIEMGKSSAYENVNYCTEAQSEFTSSPLDSSACDCSYTKVNYGDQLTKFWDYYDPNFNGLFVETSEKNKGLNNGTGVVKGICSGNNPSVCSKDSDCATGSACLLAKSSKRYLGWYGYCVEEDNSRSLYANKEQHPCLTWHPIDFVKGVMDINSTPEAGYQPTEYGKYYCLEAKGNAVLSEQRTVVTDDSPIIGLGIPKKTLISSYITLPKDTSPYRKQILYVSEPAFGYYWWDNLKDAVSDSDYLWDYSKFAVQAAQQYGGLTTRKYTYYPTGFNKDKNFSDDYKDFMPVFEPLNYRDIDKIIIHVDKASIEDQGNDGGVPVGTFVIRKGSMDDPDKNVMTVYNKDVKDKNGQVGCQVMEDKPGISASFGKSEDHSSNLEACGIGIQETLVTTGGKVRTEIRDSVIGKDKEKNSREFIVMRAFFNDPSTNGGEPLKYITEELGFFPEYGDKNTNGDGYLVEMCKNGSELAQDSMEILFVFNKKSVTKIINGKTVIYEAGDLYDIAMAHCTSDADEEHQTAYNIFIEVDLNEYCTKIADVASMDSAAFTDKIWGGSNYRLGSSFYDHTYYGYNTLQSPFGALPLGTDPIQNAILYSLRLKSLDGGVPYSCYGVCSGNALGGKYIDYDKDPPKQELKPTSGIGAGVTKILGYLFAKTNSIFSLPEGLVIFDGKKDYVEIKNDGSAASVAVNNYNITETVQTKVGKFAYEKAPKVLSLSDVCLSSNKCYEGKEGLTINDRSAGDINIYTQPAFVNLRFYAYADMNQMPIKKMTVRWGDGNEVGPLKGAYRNKRGVVDGTCEELKDTSLCLDTVCKQQGKSCAFMSFTYSADEKGQNIEYRDKLVTTGIGCIKDLDCRGINQCLAESVAPNFGQIANKTCDNGFYEFHHAYQCFKDGKGYV
ncbi:MAG: hypothetical protein ABIH87_00960, partial [bacterium]